MSKIKSVTAHPLRYPEPHDHGNTRYITLARVETEDGAVGWGECISQFPESCALSREILIGFRPVRRSMPDVISQLVCYPVVIN